MVTSGGRTSQLQVLDGTAHKPFKDCWGLYLQNDSWQGIIL